MAVLFLLMIILFGPALVYTKITELKPFVVVLRDSSASMNTTDNYLDDESPSVANVLGSDVSTVRSTRPSRVAILDAAIEKDGRKFIRELEYRGKLKLVDFSNRLGNPSSASRGQAGKRSGTAHRLGRGRRKTRSKPSRG